MAYLTDSVGAGREGYYTDAVAAGEPAGLWYGRGAERLGLSGEVDADLMKAVYLHRLDPRDERSHDMSRWGETAQLGSRPKAYRSPEDLFKEYLAGEPGASPERREELTRAAEQYALQNREFFDLTFSPEKSVSILGVAYERAASDARAAGRWDEAASWDEKVRTLEQCVVDGARAGVDYVEETASYARRGHNGVRIHDTEGLTVAQFLQHDNRNRDPQLHVHQAVLSTVEGVDGKWTKLYDKPLFMEARNGASAMSSRAMYALMSERLGVEWKARIDGNGFEIVGVPLDVMDLMSSRRRETTGELDRLKGEWVEKYGREPRPRELSKLTEQAVLTTRAAKTHDGKTREEMLERWEREARQEVHTSLAQIAHDVTERARENPVRTENWQFASVVDRAKEAAREKHTTWTRSQLMREINANLPGNLGLPAEKTPALLSELTDAALVSDRSTRDPGSQVELPDSHRLRNGESVFHVPGSERFTDAQQLAGEDDLRTFARQAGGWALSHEDVNTLISRYAENGKELGADKQTALRGLLTDGAKLSTLIAPAGAGKSYLMGMYADAMREHGRSVVGLAPSQVAADELADVGVTAANIDRWLAVQARIDEGRASENELRFAVSRGDSVVIDEASMASREHVRAVRELCEPRGVKIVQVGDPHQLGAVGAGGGLADLAELADYPYRYELTEVHRFREPWEAQASLGLRERDPAALDEYQAQGRLWAHGTPEQAQEGARRHWLADTLAGRDSVLLARSNEAAYEMSAAARRELAAAGRLHADGPAVQLGRDKNLAGVGDLVQARENAWHLGKDEEGGRAVINRAMYRVAEVGEGGALAVLPVIGREDGRELLGGKMTLPPEYVGRHVTLGYASTVHAAEGRTLDTAHPVIDRGWDAASLYVAMTRGAEANHAHVSTVNPARDYPSGQALEYEPRAARARMADIMRGDSDENRSAHQVIEREYEESRSVHTTMARMLDVASPHIGGRTSTTLDRLAADGVLSEEDRVKLAADGTSGVDRILRAAELAGHDRDVVLREAVGRGDFRDARNAGQVLYSRIGDAAGRDFTPRLSSFADLVPWEGMPEAYRVPAQQLADIADDRRRELGSRTAEDKPGWALTALGEPPEDDPVARVEWEDKAGWAAASRELAGHTSDEDILGPPPPAGLAEKYAVWREAHTRLDLPDAGADEREMSVGGLRTRVEAYRREEAWAPRYVADELAETRRRAEKARVDGEVFGGRLVTVKDEDRAGLSSAWVQARNRANELDERVKQLEVADDARAAWWAHTLETRDRKERAEVELAARGIDPAEREDRVTAEEWLEARARHLEQDEPHRDITPADVADDVESNACQTATPPATSSDVVVDRDASGEDQIADDDEAAERQPTEDEFGVFAEESLDWAHHTAGAVSESWPGDDVDDQQPAGEADTAEAAQVEPAEDGDDPDLDASVTTEPTERGADAPEHDRGLVVVDSHGGDPDSSAEQEHDREPEDVNEEDEDHDAIVPDDEPAVAKDADVPAGDEDPHADVDGAAGDEPAAADASGAAEAGADAVPDVPVDDKPERESEREPEPARDDNGPLLETDVPDVRDTSEEDPTEHWDTTPRDRVSSEEDTSAAVERARDAAREMREREAEDSRRAAEDDARRSRAVESESRADVAVDA